MRLAVCLLVVCVCAPILSHAESKTYEGPGWDTPEEAVLVYLEGLRDQDLDKMISAYAVETHIDHFDMQAQLERVRGYTMSMVPRMSNSTDLIRSINVETRKNAIVQSILTQLTSICLHGEKAMDLANPVSFPNDSFAADIRGFIEELDQMFTAVDFCSLNVLRFTPPEQIAELYASERNQENMQKQAVPYGADEIRSVPVFFTVGGLVGGFGPDAARYGDRWFLHSPSGNISIIIGIPAANAGLVAGPLEELSEALSFAGIDLADDLLIDQIEDY